MSDFDLFGELLEHAWKKEWVGMPEFSQDDCQPSFQITMNFEFFKDVQDFGRLLNQSVSPKTNSLWHPKQDRIEPKNFLYINEP